MKLSTHTEIKAERLPKVLLVGNPNVGKSLLFNRLTGRYAVVSNYPGTTVEVSRGRAKRIPFEIIDTPGMYSLCPITEEERVTHTFLFKEKAIAVIHVIDAKNIERMLGLTLQLIKAGLPVIVVLNMIDEARSLGIKIDVPGLQQLLGAPVIETAATTGEGFDRLLESISNVSGTTLNYDPVVEQGISAALALQAEVKRILSKCAVFPILQVLSKREKLSRLLISPLFGFPILALVLYFGLYEFVGVFGSGTLVDFLEDDVFNKYLIPWVDRLVLAVIPWATLRELFIGDYGIFTLGIRYAVAIIFPIVGTFFISFSILEDSGYLPRLAMLLDRGFKMMGLNGRAVIPMVLGFGCGTMATMVTRTLETNRERIITTLLLALAIPCSAQIGVILGLLAGRPYVVLAWGGFVMIVMGVTGVLAARFLPGSRPGFYMEFPPLRLPRTGNVMVKTYSRMVWYFKEVLPLFILASLFIWIGQVTGLFQLAIKALEPVVQLMGLPKQAAVAFLFGFFRRDYGVAGLYDLQKANLLNGNQLAVAAIALTLFLPCIAQFLIMKKERGTKMAVITSTGIIVLAIGVGAFANHLFIALGVNL